MVCTDSEDAPEDFICCSSSEDVARASSRTGESSDSVKTSSDREASVLRGAVLALSLPVSRIRCAVSPALGRGVLLRWLTSGTEGSSSRSLG